jgi:hypothetical protein
MKGIEGHGQEEQKPEELTRRDMLISALGAGALAALTPHLASISEAEPTSEIGELERIKQLIPKGAPITVRLNDKGQLEFEHEHQETKNTLDFLSGRGEITEKHIATLLRTEFFGITENSGGDLLNEDTIQYLYSVDTVEEIVRFYRENWDFLKPSQGGYFTSPEDYAQAKLDSAKTDEEKIRAQIHELFYQKLWEVYLKCGAPNIERVDTYDETTRGKERNHSSFTPSLNRVRLDDYGRSDVVLGQLLQELAHSYSFYTDPERFEAGRENKDRILEGNPDLSGDERKDLLMPLYRENGNEEFYAHQVIYPRLVAELAPYHPTLQVLLRHELYKLQKRQNTIE